MEIDQGEDRGPEGVKGEAALMPGVEMASDRALATAAFVSFTSSRVATQRWATGFSKLAAIRPTTR